MQTKKTFYIELHNVWPHQHELVDLGLSQLTFYNKQTLLTKCGVESIDLFKLLTMATLLQFVAHQFRLLAFQIVLLLQLTPSD